jgi:hypothetical protein
MKTQNRWAMVSILSIICLTMTAMASIPYQEISMIMDVNPAVVDVLGDYYIESDNPNDPKPCQPDGILLTYHIKLLGDLPGGGATRDAYDVTVRDKFPWEAKLSSVEHVINRDSLPPDVISIEPYSGTDMDTYYTSGGDIVKIHFDKIEAGDFPKEIIVKVYVSCCASPATLYNMALIRSQNDIDLENNFANTSNYIGLKYDRDFSLDSYINLLNC